jgi:hypothetical protein
MPEKRKLNKKASSHNFYSSSLVEVPADDRPAQNRRVIVMCARPCILSDSFFTYQGTEMAISTMRSAIKQQILPVK